MLESALFVLLLALHATVPSAHVNREASALSAVTLLEIVNFAMWF
jgi:hypothetical protein